MTQEPCGNLLQHPLPESGEVTVLATKWRLISITAICDDLKMSHSSFLQSGIFRELCFGFMDSEKYPVTATSNMYSHINKNIL